MTTFIAETDTLGWMVEEIRTHSQASLHNSSSVRSTLRRYFDAGVLLYVSAVLGNIRYNPYSI